MKYFGNCKSLDDLKNLYRKLAFIHHPDKGGSVEEMQDINEEFSLSFAIFKHNQKSSFAESAQGFSSSVYAEYKFTGDRYDPSLHIKDITKIMRDYVKYVYPTYKFSIRMEHYSSIEISLVEAPQNIFVEGVQEKYYQVNQYYIDDDHRLNALGKAVFKDIRDMLSSYNYDDSDSMSDYFNTNFYYGLNVGRWDKPFQIVEKTARITGGKANLKAKALPEK